MDSYLDEGIIDNFSVKFLDNEFLVSTPKLSGNGEGTYFMFYDLKNKKVINRLINKFTLLDSVLQYDDSYYLDFHSKNNLLISAGAWGIVMLKTDSLTDVKEDNKHSIPLSPNPSNGIVNLSLFSGQQENTIIKLFSSDGKEIKTLFSGTLEGEIYQFDSSSLFAGTYFLSVITKTSSKTYKLIKE
jgi:hypothetical protein